MKDTKMTATPNLNLPYIMPAQAQKHATHNEAILALDAIVQINALSRILNTPPATPNDGDRYIVTNTPTGAWTGHSLEITAWQDGSWEFYAPEPGWLCWVRPENKLLAWDGIIWDEITGAASSDPISILGVNATADTTNRFSINTPALLLNRETDDIQMKFNKEASVDTASVLFQTGFSGRAEIGLTGDDNFHFKVSNDGASWNDAVTLQNPTGRVSFSTSTSSNVCNIGGDRTILFSGGLVNTIKTGGNRLHLNDGGTIDLISTNIRINGFDAGALLNIEASTATKTPLLIQATAGQSADLMKIRDSSGTSILEIDKDGNFAVTDNDGSVVTNIVNIYHNSTANQGDGGGCGILFQTDNTGNNKQPLGSLQMLTTDAVGYLTADFVVNLHNNSLTATEVFIIKANGNVGIGVTSPSTTLDVNGPIKYGAYTLATVPNASASGAGATIYVSDETSGSTLAFSDGTDWRRTSDRVVIS